MTGGPQHLGKALSDLIALRGIGRIRGNAQLAGIWREVAGERIAAATKVLGIKRSVLQIQVSNAPLLSELVSFHKSSLLARLQEQHADLKIRGLKFRLQSRMKRS
ncbi:MAG: DciA family protein [Planctomycetaceae bacterium]